MIHCTDNVTWLKQQALPFCHLIVTSPPYDDIRTYGGHEWDFDALCPLLVDSLYDGGVLVWVVADQINGGHSGSSLRQALAFQEAGLLINDVMIYQTNKAPQAGPRYHRDWEYMFVLSKGKPRVFNPLMVPCIWAGFGCTPTQRDTDGTKKSMGRLVVKEKKKKNSIWHFSSGNHIDRGGKAHPAVFPLQLAKDHIVSWTNEGDVVFDPFAGSGTTLRAAKDLGRRWVGLEVNPEYVAMIEQEMRQEVLF